MGAIAIIEMREAMAKDEAEDRRLLIAEEVRGGQDTDQTAGHSSSRPPRPPTPPRPATSRGPSPSTLIECG